MKCRSLTAIVLAVAMLVSFGLCNWSVAADTISTGSGAVYNNNTNIHVQLGTYDNTLSSTNQPFTIHHSVNTFPYTYHNYDFYNSQLVGVSGYETYYELQRGSEIVKINVVDVIYETGITGDTATHRGDDGHSGYSQLMTVYPGIGFRAKFINIIQGNDDQFYGSRYDIIRFGFNPSGAYMAN